MVKGNRESLDDWQLTDAPLGTTAVAPLKRNGAHREGDDREAQSHTAACIQRELTR